MCSPLFLLILAQALTQVSHGLKCNLCHSTGDFSFNCTGEVATLTKKDDACIATVVGKIEENNFVVIQTNKQAATNFRFPSKEPGCYFYSSYSQKKLTTAICQCRDEDFCIEKFSLDKELQKMQLPTVTCNHHYIDSKENTTCQGNFCTANLVAGIVIQDCGYGWFAHEFDIFDNATAYPMCFETNAHSIRTCHCATDNCNTADLINNVNWVADPVGCYTNQNGGAVNSGRCVGSYCTSTVQEDCPHCEYTSQFQSCVNSTVALTTNEIGMESVDSNGKIYIDIMKTCRSVSNLGCNVLINPATTPATTTPAAEHTTKGAGRNEMAIMLIVFCFIALFR